MRRWRGTLMKRNQCDLAFAGTSTWLVVGARSSMSLSLAECSTVAYVQKEVASCHRKQTDSQTCSDSQILKFSDARIFGFLDFRIIGFSNIRILGCTNSRILGFPDRRILGISNARILATADSGYVVFSDVRIFGISGSRIVEK